MALAMRQSDLAEDVGISASYLNLIEHNKRRIGGKLLLDLARVLKVEPSRLSEGMDATLGDMLRAAAQDNTGNFGPTPELDRTDELAGRFPGWTGAIAEQRKRIADLEGVIEGLQDRLGHDPVLAGSMHEVLSTVAAIRSTSNILVSDPDIDVNWRARFHRNLNEEAERLSESATALLAYFEGQGQSQSGLETPQEMVEAAFETAGHHFPRIEGTGSAGIEDTLTDMEAISSEAAAQLARTRLAVYAEDAARLPLDQILPIAEAADYDPQALLAMAGGDVAMVLRRLASLPEGGAAAVPAFGLAICDAAGALLFRRRINAFSIPRYGAGCALWPLYHVFSRPMMADMSVLSLPKGPLFQAWAVAQPTRSAGFGTAPVVEATMLLRALPEDRAPTQNPVEVGPGCQLCPRDACPARRAGGAIG